MANLIRFPYRIEVPIYHADLTPYGNDFVKPSSIQIISLNTAELYAELQAKGSDDSLRALFQGMDGLKSLNLSAWNVDDYTTFASMFKDCSSLEILDMHGLSIYGTMQEMCMNCRSLVSINLSGASVKTNNLMATFSQCYNITSIDTSGWDVSDCEDFYGLFEDCRSLTSLDFSGWDTSNATSMSAMFDGCWNLRKMWVPSSFVATSIEDDFEKPFNMGTGRTQKTHIYTDASSAAAQGWGTIHSDYVVHYGASYQDFLSA